MSAPASASLLSFDVSRAVAMTLCPRDKASSAMLCPNPLEAAVINHTGACSAITVGSSAGNL